MGNNITKKKQFEFVYRKLKKKWRFWRPFRRFFLRKKRKTMFYKLKWLHMQKRIIWHQVSVLYGKKIKKLSYKKTQTKYLFGVRFFNILSFLENRLDILVVRMKFSSNALEANILIDEKKITVNGEFKNKNYLVRVGDFIQKNFISGIVNEKVNFLLRWKGYHWRKWRNSGRLKKKRLSPNMFWLLKKNLILNCLEINYRIVTGVLLRKPFFGEVLLENKKRMLDISILKKIYCLY